MFRAGCFLGLWAMLFLWGCAASRKISQVGLREPSSLKEAEVVSDLRSLVQSTAISKKCPIEIQESFPALSMERISFPPCPEGFGDLVQLCINQLSLEERSTLEEIVNSQCRSFRTSEFGDSLENFLAQFDSSGPLGRAQRFVSNDTTVPAADIKNLSDLKLGLEEMVAVHLPLDRWLKRNGEFVLPDEELGQLYRLISQNSCKVSDDEVEHGYRTIRGMEELSRILKVGDQKEKLELFLFGVRKVIEQKLMEFFYP